jgi:hypothetical protein
MPSRVQEQKGFISLLLKSNEVQVNLILRCINKQQVLALCELTWNVLESNIKLTRYFRRILSKHVVFYKKLGDKTINFTQKVELVQSHPDKIYLLVKATRRDLEKIINGSAKDDTYI